MPGDTSAMPPQQGVGRDDPAFAEPAWQCLGDYAEKGPVVVFNGRFRVLASKDRELVAQHDDLKIFGSSRPDRETDQFTQVNHHDRVSGPHRVRRSGRPPELRLPEGRV